MAEIDSDDGFLSRWSRRKSTAHQGLPAPTAPPARPGAAAHVPSPPRPPSTGPAQAPAPATQETVGRGAAPVPDDAAAAPPPTLDEVARLTPSSDFKRFVAPGVAPEVRSAALKRLFADPHFNVMDGLDTYIDDYGKPDPLPTGMLRKMAQAEFLNLFADAKKPEAETPAAADTPAEPTADEDPALRLQPHDAAGPPDAEPGAVEDTGGER